MSRGVIDRGSCAELLDRLLDAVDDIQKAVIWADLLSGNHLWQGLGSWIEAGRLNPSTAERFGQTLDDSTLDLLCQNIKEQHPGLTASQALTELDKKSALVRQLITAATSVSSGDAIGEIADPGPFGGAFAAPWITVTTPVAVVATGDDSNGVGLVAELELQTIKGNGETHQHPGDLLSTSVNGNFTRAMSMAFRAAHVLASRQENSLVRQNPECYGRWRLTNRTTGLPIESLDGPSAGGAAFFGWYSALTERIYDSGVIVMAAVTLEEGTATDPVIMFKGVNGVKSKVEAVADLEASPIDKIMIASDENEDEAKSIGSQNIKIERLPDGPL